MQMDETFTRIRLESRRNGVRLLVLADHEKRNAIGP
jgi:hypothetical protein